MNIILKPSACKLSKKWTNQDQIYQPRHVQRLMQDLKYTNHKNNMILDCIIGNIVQLFKSIIVINVDNIWYAISLIDYNGTTLRVFQHNIKRPNIFGEFIYTGGIRLVEVTF